LNIKSDVTAESLPVGERSSAKIVVKLFDDVSPSVAVPLPAHFCHFRFRCLDWYLSWWAGYEGRRNGIRAIWMLDRSL